jgi:hypothetical protein
MFIAPADEVPPGASLALDELTMLTDIGYHTRHEQTH